MMINEIFAIGVMSGTSLDGVDLVYVKFDKNDYRNFEILNSETVSYSKNWKQVLQNAIHSSEKELNELDLNYGRLLGDIINDFINNNAIVNIDFIASHGHTILHQPEKGITLQIGNGNEIAKITKQKVVCDFRTQDVKLGGQGAPLVPIGDEIMFSNYDFCLNLGGFSNISFKKDDKRIAFDICPVNIVLNFYANKLGFEFDKSGEIAKSGTINHQLLAELNALEFYQKIPPKSLGLEWVQQNIFPLIDQLEQDVPSVLGTFTAHIATQISSIVKGSASVLYTGGGVFNTFLMQEIACYTNVKIGLPDNKLIHFKEALIFAFLGLLKIDNQVNCLASVTGAKKDHSSGVIFNA
ncbi:anhydro-N-acetylmuramic acid kinase [Polaribacter reichenbachii]|uniref:Anhydro-N-acetylmuramic acid kinase n=1 Tax=Polaribacter reichenbachii TaxID=996801 RepID=A0A1B8U397_9FLAO|nr:anhydro-N-acetylmuramic acid kinase [Polaribacter reichenbachii]APZ46526.1 anhydro-N-acetylmuramic acid kinase [Polaribacter reichenbachii]AUC17173.1 anhydro-N-acetylmuramic acid kinase [Polaribacter reichenbachii]OBY66350.1 anhydro-N-acetylmuramic acid kinase [Polaribacter reichenbachii]